MSFLIMSVSLKSLTEEQNRQRCKRFETDTLDLQDSYHSAIGRYNGQLETSYVWYDNFPIALQFAACHGQESVLLVDPDDNATLLFLDNLRTVRLGIWQAVPKYYAVQHEAWTYIDGVYYVCK